ncbi:hypothetical protein EV361DRAFT_880781 [Lentinula raphanica]|uniref:Uncharacterized protein n=1 Tax=Lentinula raphanica TaxID=153919 RepID=A0AA38P968_9AGAR|nr:hypothetical protein F5880DRAFT_1539798 [Lentinula raphanica]KAJ3838658.1 hypothetical protein F5878DRAFT_619028 [Lentinula raphanica]KAJ3977048.1 hypothetical protein EV361DRAFT_880781 [Lentinula raphanica]
MPMRVFSLITLGLLSLIFVDAAPAPSQGGATSPRYNLRSGARVPKPMTVVHVPVQGPSRKPSIKQTIYIRLPPNSPPAESHEASVSIVTGFLHIKAIWEFFELDRYSDPHRPSVHTGGTVEESEDSSLNLRFLKTPAVEAPLPDGTILFFVAGIPKCQDGLPHGCRVEFTLSQDWPRTVEAYIITIRRHPGEVRIILAQYPSPHQSAEEAPPPSS